MTIEDALEKAQEAGNAEMAKVVMDSTLKLVRKAWRGDKHLPLNAEYNSVRVM